MNADRLIGLAYVCVRWHGGYRSRGYRLACRINFNPKTDRAARLRPRDDWRAARQWAAHYTRYARRHPGAF